MPLSLSGEPRPPDGALHCSERGLVALKGQPFVSDTVGETRAGWDDLNGALLAQFLTRRPGREPTCCCDRRSLKSFLETARVGPNSWFSLEMEISWAPGV